MKNRLLIAMALFTVTVMFSCKKGPDGPEPGTFEPITFKFGTEAIAITIDQSAKTLKNMPRSFDPGQLIATAVLPSGTSISPDPSTGKDYTKGVTYTITNAQGKKYTVQITIPVYDPVNNPHGIYTPFHLNDVRNGLNDSYVLMNDIELPGMLEPTAAAKVGISDYADFGWYSIGTFYVNGGHVVFRGSLDGQNHVIRNLTSVFRNNAQPAGIDAGHDGKSNDGLFGYAARATFKNLGIQLAAEGIVAMSENGTTGYGSVGALVGRADSCTIENCYVSGNGFIGAMTNVGGLIGRGNYTTVKKSHSSLTPTQEPYAIIASGDAGGLIGSVFNCEITDSYSSSSVLSSVNIGGLIGGLSTSTVKTSFASGNVTELPQNTSAGLIPFNALGGLIGTITSVSPATTVIQNCYASGAVRGADGANINFHQGSRIGGLVGQVAPTSGPVSVSFCYATGLVSRVQTSPTVPYLIGGLIGTTPNNVFITSSTCTNYWDKEKSGQIYLGGGNSAFAQDNGYTTNGKTTTEMKTGSTFVNWDFSTVWTIAAGTNNGYPSLRSIN